MQQRQHFFSVGGDAINPAQDPQYDTLDEAAEYIVKEFARTSRIQSLRKWVRNNACDPYEMLWRLDLPDVGALTLAEDDILRAAALV